MRIEVLQSTRYPGVSLIKDDIKDIPDNEAKELIRIGKVKAVKAEIDISIETEIDLEKKTKDELVKYAADELETDIDPKLKKTEIIEIIVGLQG